MDVLLDPEVLGSAVLVTVLLTTTFVVDLLISRRNRRGR